MLLTELRALAVATCSSHLTQAQLVGPVGPTTPLTEKTKICNVLDYGAIADNATDISPALNLAFSDCVLKNENSRLYVPEGEYLLNQSVVLSNATAWALQLDGLITAAYGGNWSVERELILQGFAGAEVLNSTINGEGDQKFLLDSLVIVNGEHGSSREVHGTTYSSVKSCRLRVLLFQRSWRHSRPRLPLPQRGQVMLPHALYSSASTDD